MIIEVTKRQVLKAIATEPLAAGAFFHSDRGYGMGALRGKVDNNKQCPVCAIGGIFDLVKGKDIRLGRLEAMAMRMTEAAQFDFMDGYGPIYEALKRDAIDRKSVRSIKAAVRRIVKDKPLSALSLLFEALSDPTFGDSMKTKQGFANYKMRRILSNFVKANFPAKLELNTRKKY